MPKGVYQRADDLGEKITEGKRPGYVQKKEAARQLYEEGVTPKNIARQLSIPRGTVKKWVLALPTQSNGWTKQQYGYAAHRVFKITGRDREDVRVEMEAKADASCCFCGNGDFDNKGWFGPAFHHWDNGIVERSHVGCNAIHAHARL